MLNRRLTLTAAVAVVLSTILTGCQAAGVASPASSAASSVAPAASAATGSPSASASAAAMPSASVASSAAASAAPGNDLASLVPETINDVPVTVSQVDPASFLGTNDLLHLASVLQALDKTPADVEVIAGGGGAGTNSVIIQAVRIDGTDASALTPQLQTVLTALPNSSVETATVGGKDVLSLGGDRYAYVSNDVVFFVSASNDEMAQATLEALP